MGGLPELHWRISSYSSGNGGACVEVAPAPGGWHVRDSKDRSGPAHRFTRATWRSFLTALDRD